MTIQKLRNSMKEVLKKNIEEIISISDKDFEYVYSLFNHQEFRKKEFLITRDEYVNDAFFVVSGLLKLTFTDSDGKQHIVSFAMENWYESDFPAFFNKTQATMELQALENTTVLSLSNNNYYKICKEVPLMEHFFLKKANSGFIGAQQRILTLLTADAQERHDNLKLQYPQLFQRVSKTQLASFLGVSRETLSRLST